MMRLFGILLMMIALAACSGLQATDAATVTPVSEDTVYFEGMIVIAQYYELLDQARYQEAYRLLGPTARQHSPTVEDYVASAARAFTNVKILVIMPYDEWVRQQGHEPSNNSEFKNLFYVQIMAEGEGGMSGSAVSGEIQTLFITVISEDGAWKIDSFATGLGN